MVAMWPNWKQLKQSFRLMKTHSMASCPNVLQYLHISGGLSLMSNFWIASSSTASLTSSISNDWKWLMWVRRKQSSSCSDCCHAGLWQKTSRRSAGILRMTRRKMSSSCCGEFWSSISLTIFMQLAARASSCFSLSTSVKFLTRGRAKKAFFICVSSDLLLSVGDKDIDDEL